MRRWPILLVFLLTGCSTHCCADFLDTFFPGRLPQAPRYYGGVGPQPSAPPMTAAPAPSPPPPP